MMERYNDEDEELRKLKEQLKRAEKEALKREMRRRIRELSGGLWLSVKHWAT